MTMFYDYTISDMIRELNRNKKLQTHFNINNILTEQQFYEYFSRYNEEIFHNLTNSMCAKIYKTNRNPINVFNRCNPCSSRY